MIDWLKNIWHSLFSPAPPEWGFLQRLYTDKYVLDENDCSNMAADYAMHCWKNGFPKARIIIGVREGSANHAWVRVRKGARTWYVDPSADRWTTKNTWAKNYDSTMKLGNVWIGRGAEWRGKYYTRDDNGDVVKQ